MKVLFIYQDNKMPSSRIRVLNLLPEIQEGGIHAEALVYPKNISEKIRLFKNIGQFDIIYLQKKLPSPVEAKLFKSLSKRLIFDFDDAIYYKDDSHPFFESSSRQIKFKSIVRGADLIIAGNRILADYARQFNRKVISVPSAVETRGVPRKDYTVENENFIIGWVGGKGNLHHLEILSKTFQKLAQHNRIQVNIICNDTIKIPGVEINFIPWELETQGTEIARFDVGIMPLPSNKWTEGKCAYKALQYMAAAVPPVVSDVGISRDIVGHGREGFVVSSADGFFDAIETFINNKDQRREMGENARKKAETYFSVEVVGKSLADVLKKMTA